MATWTKGVQFAGTDGVDTEIWFGKITTTGLLHRHLHVVELDRRAQRRVRRPGVQLRARGSNTVWASGQGRGPTNGASSTTVPFPSLTPRVGAGELYFGYAQVANSAAKGATSGLHLRIVTSQRQRRDLRPQRARERWHRAPPSPRRGSSTIGGRAPVAPRAGTPPPVPDRDRRRARTPVPAREAPRSPSPAPSFTGATVVKFGDDHGQLHREQRHPDHRHLARRGQRHRGHDRHRPGGHLSATRPADQFTFTTPPRPPSPELSPTSGPDGRRYLGHHHRHRLHRGHRGRLRHQRAATSFTVNSATEHHRHLAAGARRSPSTSPSPPRAAHRRSTPGRPVHLRRAAPDRDRGEPHTRAPPPGGTSVTITGTGFTGATAVKFGAVAATAFTVNSDHLDHRHVAAGVRRRPWTSPSPPAGGTSDANEPADQITYALSSVVITPVGTLIYVERVPLSSPWPSHRRPWVTCSWSSPRWTPPAPTRVLGVGRRGAPRGPRACNSPGARGRRRDLVRQGDEPRGAIDRHLQRGRARVTGDGAEYGAQEFGAGRGANTVWTLDTAGTSNGASSTTVPFPSLTAERHRRALLRLRRGRQRGHRRVHGGLHHGGHHQRQRRDLRHRRVGDGGPQCHTSPRRGPPRRWASS